jgi:hypothetical protein
LRVEARHTDNGPFPCTDQSRSARQRTLPSLLPARVDPATPTPRPALGREAEAHRKDSLRGRKLFTFD